MSGTEKDSAAQDEITGTSSEPVTSTGNEENAPVVSSSPEPLVLDEQWEGDSAFGDDSVSETTSLASYIAKGYIEHGRKYQSTKEQAYWGPCDDKQFEAQELCHLLHYILDSTEPNPLFLSPVDKTAQRILDVGTGEGTWAIEVADRFPSATVYGIDLYPPPATWVPPNCIFQVDDATREWTWDEKFDLVHIRYSLGAFTPEERHAVYQQAFEHLNPGGWIEELEPDIRVVSDDGSLDPKGPLGGWGASFIGCGQRAGRPIDVEATMRASIEKAGFVNVHEKLYKTPFGSWPKAKIYKDAGRVGLEFLRTGLEGFAMFLLTHFGAPTPWSPEEVQVYIAQVRAELSTNTIHGYSQARRVWAQKPEA